MNNHDGPVPKHRNRNFDETHLLLIEKACELIADSATDGVSISALARVTGINRSTIYYHFNTREELMCAAQTGRASSEPLTPSLIFLAGPESANYLRCSKMIRTS